MIRLVVVLVAFIVVVRAGIGLASLAKLDADPDAYRAIAETFARTGILGLSSPGGIPQPTAFRPPLYPAVLSIVTSDGKLASAAVAILHALLAGITAIATYLTAQALWRGSPHRETAAVIAMVLVSIDPVLIEQSRLVMTETLATSIVSLIALTLAWYASARKRHRGNKIGIAAAIGILLALAFYCRPTFIVWSAMIVIGIGLHQSSPLTAQQSTRLGWWRDRSWASAAMIALVMGLAVAAWARRNLQTLGHPFWATSHGGYTLLLGNNPMFYDYLRTAKFGETWNPDLFFTAYQHRYDGDPMTAKFWQTDWSRGNKIGPDGGSDFGNEASDDRRVYRAATATIARQPDMFLRACLTRLGRLWAPFPHTTSGRSPVLTTTVGVYYIALFSAAMIGGWKHRRLWIHPVYWSSIALAITLCGVHAFYWSNIRMRAPVTPAIAIFAASVIARPERISRPDDQRPQE